MELYIHNIYKRRKENEGGFRHMINQQKDIEKKGGIHNYVNQSTILFSTAQVDAKEPGPNPTEAIAIAASKLV